MNILWFCMIVLSVITGIFTSRMEQLSQGVMEGASSALQLFLTIAAMMCLWGGLSEIAERSGLTGWVEKLLRPLLRVLFPRLNRDSQAARAISMNMTANLLGLGNAATPLGIQAMQELKAQSTLGEEATEEMVTFVVVNTASLQILPTTVAMLRHSHGSSDPMGILLPVWIASVVSFTGGIVAVKLLQKRKRRGYI